MVKEVMVVKRGTLFKGPVFQGFISNEERDFLSLILDNFEYKDRDESLEINPAYKQIVPYIVLINPNDKKVFGFKRFKKMPGIHETRLHNRFAIGLGGHVDKQEEEIDVLTDAMMRELKEEVKMENYPVPNIVGFVNDEKDEVGTVHFGIIAVAETLENVSKMEEGGEVYDEKFYTPEEIDSLLNSGIDVDGWTKLSWQFIKEYLKNC